MENRRHDDGRNEDLTDRAKIQRKEIMGRLERRRELEDVAFILSTEQGRRFVWRLLTQCGISRLSYSGPGRNEDTCFYEGQRNIGNIFFADIKNFPEQYLLMMKESQKAEQNIQQ